MDARAPVTDLPDKTGAAMCEKYSRLRHCPLGRAYPVYLGIRDSVPAIVNATGSRTNARQWEVTAEIVCSIITLAYGTAYRLLPMLRVAAQTRGNGR